MNFSKRWWVRAAVSSTALSLSAAQMRPLPLAELSQRADLVVLGTVRSKTCERDGEGRIFTKVEFSVSEVWKGASTNTTLTIFHGGGAIGDERADVSGQVEYTIGEEVAAFLVFNPRGETVTLGLAQGKFHVWPDPQTGEKFAHNIFHGATKPATSAATFATGNATQSAPAPLTLSQLKQAAKEAKP